MGLRRPHEWAELARAFAERKYLCAGVSETWMVGTGRNELYDAGSNVYLVCTGLDSKDSPARGKWGVGFCLSSRAYKCWKQSGQQLITKSARVASIRFDLKDKNGRLMAFSHTRGRAMQQNAAAAEKLKFFSDLSSCLSTSQPKDFAVLTMDTNCSVGRMAPNLPTRECKSSVIGQHGEPRVNDAGLVLKSWLAGHCLHAVSTHYKRRCRTFGSSEGCGTWRHPRSQKRCQNDHIFVSKGLLPRVNNCRSQAPMCHSDHLAVKATFRVQAKLAQKPKPTLTEEIKARDYMVLRPFCPSFDAAEFTKFLENVRKSTRSQQKEADDTRLPACEMLQCAVQEAAQQLPIRAKPSAGWHEARLSTLEPLRLHRNALTRKWIKSGKRDPRLEEAKRSAARDMNKAASGCFNAHVQEKWGEQTNPSTVGGPSPGGRR
jgi:hypothetical protein